MPTNHDTLKDALKSVSDDIKNPNKTGSAKVTPDTLVAKLKEKSVPKAEFEKNLEKWPDPIQNYIKQKMFEYLESATNLKSPIDPISPTDLNYFKNEDMPVIDKFFEKALQDTDYSDTTGYTDERWAEAMKAVAQQLRRYYGMEDRDDELPCWRKG